METAFLDRACLFRTSQNGEIEFLPLPRNGTAFCAIVSDAADMSVMFDNVTSLRRILNAHVLAIHGIANAMLVEDFVEYVFDQSTACPDMYKRDGGQKGTFLDESQFSQ